MKIKDWIVKDIYFTENERSKVSKKVRNLLKNGWELFSGSFDNNLIYGEESSLTDENELVQLHKILVRDIFTT